MANHLTPEEIADEFGLSVQEVIQFCLDEAVPVYQGKICKGLFKAQLDVSMPQLATVNG